MGRRLAAAALILAVLGAGGRADAATTTTVPAPAETTTTVAATTVPAPVAVAPTTTVPGVDLAQGGEGVDGMVPAPDLRGENAPTLMERYPPAAYKWTGDYGAGDVANGLPIINGLAVVLMSLLLMLGVVTTRTVGWAFSLPAMSTDLVEHVVQAVTGQVFWPFAMALLFATGVYLAWLSFRARLVEAVQQGLWACVVVLITLGVAWAPGRLLGWANDATNTLARETLGTVAATVPTPGAEDPTGTVATYNGDRSTQALRRTLDQWWRLFIFTPWSVGELGDPAKLPGAGERILQLHSANDGNLTEAERALMLGTGGEVPGCPQGKTAALSCARARAFSEYRDGTLEQVPGMGSWVNGKHPTERVVIALLALVAALVSSVILLGLALAMVWYTYAGTFRVLMIPVMALRGFHPRDGQARFTQYLADTAATYVKRIGVALVLALILAAYVAVSDSAARQGWAYMAVAQVLAGVMIVVLLLQHRKATHGKLTPAPIRALGRAGLKVAQLYPQAAVATALLRNQRRGPDGGQGGPTAPPPTPPPAAGPRRVTVTHAERVRQRRDELPAGTTRELPPARPTRLPAGPRPAGELERRPQRALPVGARPMPAVPGDERRVAAPPVGGWRQRQAPAPRRVIDTTARPATPPERAP